jgi:hypothetical protein
VMAPWPPALPRATTAFPGLTEEELPIGSVIPLPPSDGAARCRAVRGYVTGEGEQAAQLFLGDPGHQQLTGRCWVGSG